MSKINGYRKLTYIQSSGTQYINTGVSASTIGSSERAIYDVSFTSFDATVFGSTGANYGSTSLLYTINSGGGSGYFYFGNVYVTNSTATSLNTKYSYDIYGIKSGTCTLKRDGTTIQTFTSSNSIANQNIYLFACNCNGSVARKSSIKLYNFKLYVDDVLVRDFIPVERESDSVLGLYDLVNNVFYTNAGSGTFTKGEYVLETNVSPSGLGTVTTTSDGSNNYVATATKSGLSKFLNWTLNGYTQLDYIESSGTQYIDTGFSPTTTTEIELNYKLGTNYSSYRGIMGSYTNTSGSYGFALEMGTYDRLWNNNNWYSYTITKDTSTTYKFSYKSDTKFKINDITITDVSITANTYSTYLFGTRYSTATTPYAYGCYKLYSCKIWDNDTLVRDFIPVIRHIDGQIGLYDLVGHKFYGNSGTGVFTGGSL